MFDLIMKFEHGEIESLGEAVEVAHAILDSGLTRSAGRYGRFIRDIALAIEEDGGEIPTDFLPFL